MTSAIIAKGMNVSVIIPTYNRLSQTLRAIDSVLQQTYPNWELIIVDDGSANNEFDRYHDFCRQHISNDFLVVRTPNLGVSHARNLGVQLSRAPWVAFLDSDDEWLPKKLEIQMNYLARNPNCVWVHSEEKWMRNGVYQTRKKKHRKTGGSVFLQCVKQCFIGPSTVVLCKNLFQQVSLFNEDFPVCEDYELWLKISEKFPVGYIDQELIVKHGGHQDQLSSKFKAMDYWRLKALLPFLPKLPAESSDEIIAFAEKKAQILLRGFIKYGHKKRQLEMKKAMQLIQLVKSSYQSKSTRGTANDPSPPLFSAI